jgi:hypothetical protein
MLLRRLLLRFLRGCRTSRSGGRDNWLLDTIIVILDWTVDALTRERRFMIDRRGGRRDLEGRRLIVGPAKVKYEKDKNDGKHQGNAVSTGTHHLPR